MSNLVRGLRALQVCLGPPNFFLALADRCFGCVDLVLKFRNLQNGDQLPFFNAIAHIDIDPFHITRNFRVHINFLIRPELRRHGEGSREISAVNLGRSNGWDGSGICAVLGGI